MLLEKLVLSGVGPTEALSMACAPRLNVLTGDNGLGKSFLLDVIWWIFTRTLAGEEIQPREDAREAKVTYQFEGSESHTGGAEVIYKAGQRGWSFTKGHRLTSELVIYARVDGGFSVWGASPETFHFSADAVWDGLSLTIEGRETTVCNGLIRDWVLWQTEDSKEFKLLTRFLEILSPSAEETLRPGPSVRQTRGGMLIAQKFPTIETAYGVVPLTLASAAVRRVIALAYLLVWSWQEHVTLNKLLGLKNTQHITLLIDEVETHLHPQWQRRIIPSLLKAISDGLRPDGLTTQIFLTTHSPLILASLEPHFDEQRDKLWTFDLVRQEGRIEVEFSQVPWRRRGDANSWLTSEVFDLKQARSLEAERALEQARALLREHEPEPAALMRATEALRASLASHDSFWMRWVTYLEERGVKT